tara:strand:- start:554 stop:796 length:243 start_codon:yes stop_codon:yes gene_type:complete
MNMTQLKQLRLPLPITDEDLEKIEAYPILEKRIASLLVKLEDQHNWATHQEELNCYYQKNYEETIQELREQVTFYRGYSI